MTNREEWLSAKIAYINGLKSPSEQQRLLVLLAEKKNRTTTDEKTLSALIRAEKTAEKAAAAKARVTAIIAAERKAAARAERKARDHELYKAAGLMIVAGLVDSKTGRFRKNFLQTSARATNEYKDRTDVAYMVNRFADPNIMKFFHAQNITIDADAFALSEMLQWIWRSAIRDDRPINLYIPSKRMRELLINWIDTTNGGKTIAE